MPSVCRVTSEEGTPIDPATLGSYSGEQNLFLHMPSIAFYVFKSMQPSSNTSATFSLSPHSSNPVVTLCHSFHQHFPLSYHPITPQHKVLDILHFPQITLTTDPVFPSQSNPSTSLTIQVVIIIIFILQQEILHLQ